MTKNTFNHSPYIKKIWMLTNKNTILRKSLGNMVGDGRLELVFVTGNGYITQFGKEQQFWGEGIYVGGHLNIPLELEILPNTQITFVKLEPWAAMLISGFDFRASMNQTLYLEELNKPLHKKMLNCGGTAFSQKSFKTLHTFMEESWKKQKDFQLIRFMSVYFEENFSSFNFHKKELLQKVNLSSRSLEMKFGRAVGLTPKKFANTIRFRQIMEQIYHRPQTKSLTELAHRFGFYDQAHFIRSCNQLMGQAPSGLSDENCFVTDPNEKFRYYTI